MTAQTSAGYTLSIGTTATNPSGDTYTLIGEVTNVSAFGKSYQEVTHNPVANRETQKFKGAYNSGTMTIDLAMDVSDAGQEDVLTALDSDSLYNFRLEYNDSEGSHGSYRRFKARVMQYTENPGQVNNIVTAQIQLGIQGAITRVAAA
jgi:hypothetical protein